MPSHPLALLAALAWPTDTPLAFIAAALVALVATVAMLLSVVLIARRRLARDVRAIVSGIETLRTPGQRSAAGLDPGSPLALVADAVERLGADLREREAGVATRVARSSALAEAARRTPLVVTDLDGEIRGFSAGAAELLGWEEDELVARPLAVLFEEAAYRELLPKLSRKTLRRQGVTARSRMLRREGGEVPVELVVRWIGGEAVFEGFVLMLRDCAEQERLERAWQASEARYRSLVEGLDEGLVVVQDGRIVFANPAAEALLAAPARELVGTPLRERITARDVLVVDERLAALERAGQGSEVLSCALAETGGAVRAEIRLLASAGEHEGRPAVLLLLQDRTPDRRAENELRRNEARLDAVLEATSDGILFVAAESEGGLVQITNRAFGELLDVPEKELLGVPVQQALRRLRRRGDAAANVARLVAEAVAGGLEREARIVSREDAQRELAVRVSPLPAARGDEPGWRVAVRDLTEQRHAERRLQEQAEKLQLRTVELERAQERLSAVHADLLARSAELDRLNEELRRLDGMKSRLLGNVSHELQTPLVSVRGYTEMILKERLGPITEEQRHGLSLSLKNVDRLIAMIDNLLTFSRDSGARGDLALARFALAPLVGEAVETVREQVAAGGLRLDLVPVAPGLQVEGDRNKLLQVFLNLLSNAIKYNRRGGSITLEARRGRPGQIEVRVSDTGVGIPRDALPRIFDRHFQVRREDDPPSEGSGLGLAIVRDILRLHGCTIRAESQEGKGSTFVFTLPEAEADTAAASSDRTDLRVAPALEEQGEPAPAGEPGQPDPEIPGPDETSDPRPRPRFRVIRREGPDGGRS